MIYTALSLLCFLVSVYFYNEASEKTPTIDANDVFINKNSSPGFGLHLADNEFVTQKYDIIEFNKEDFDFGKNLSNLKGNESIKINFKNRPKTGSPSFGVDLINIKN